MEKGRPLRAARKTVKEFLNRCENRKEGVCAGEPSGFPCAFNKKPYLVKYYFDQIRAARQGRPVLMGNQG